MTEMLEKALDFILRCILPLPYCEVDGHRFWWKSSKEPYHYTVHCKPEEWPFYRTFAKVLRTLKVKIQNNDFKWDEDMLKEMM